MLRGWLMLTSLVVLLVAWNPAASADGPSAVEPTLHFRSGALQAKEQAEWHNEEDHFQDLLPVVDGRWGPLLGADQFLISLENVPSTALQLEVIATLEAHGGSILYYIPDFTLLAIGHKGAAAAVRRVPGVVWVGRYLPSYKIAPEWKRILNLIEESHNVEDLTAGKMLNGEIGGSDFTDVEGPSEDFFGALEMDVSGSEPRFVMEVQFPHIPKLEKGAEYRPGQAAAKDWGDSIEGLFGGNVTLVAEGHGVMEVLCPARALFECIELFSTQPSVHWIHPKAKTQLHNWRASGIIQSGMAPKDESGVDSAGTHPIWAAGIQGEGQVVGCGDSGIDVDSCFFYDPAVRFKDGIKIVASKEKNRESKRFFESDVHRKVKYYQGTADFVDINGHGTHVVGSILGNPYYNTDPQATANRGMAPHARVAFMDLGGDDSRSIYTPRELSRFYYPNTYEQGARIHSDSWGSDSPVYDVLSAEVDKFTWEHPDFLPIFAGGNYGELSPKYVTTVTSPAVAKNCLAVGATLTSNQPLRAFRGKRVETYEILVETLMADGKMETQKHKVLEAGFGGSWSSLISRSKNGGINLQGAIPRTGCTPLTGSVKGSIVIVERGDCKFVTKLRNAQMRNALGVIVTNNFQHGYFQMTSNVTTDDLTIPMGAVPLSIGRELWEMVELNREMVVKVSGRMDPKYSYDNIADFSSGGPTPDRRVKPDIVAPGLIRSAYSDGGFSSVTGQCRVTTMSGTSMATPIVAGAATLIRQYFVDGFYPTGKKYKEHGFSPSAALVKASLLGGAFPLDGFTEAGLPLEPPPSFRQGFGRVQLDRSIPVQGSSRWKSGWRMQVVDGAEMTTGESHNYCVKALGGPLKVTLVWTDYPASPSSRKALVNDLDLVVRSAGLQGRVLLGNGVEDRVNNVEQVSVDDIPEGNIAIIVKGNFVLASHGPQKYALVVHGRFNGLLPSPNNPVSLKKSSSAACIITLAIIKAGPEGATGDNSPTFSFATQSGVAPLGGFECQLTDAEGATNWGGLHDWKECTSPVKYEKLPDNPYKFSVRPAGEDVLMSRSFEVDTVAPTALIFGKPIKKKSAQEDVNFEFAGADSTSVTFKCRLRSDQPTPEWATISHAGGENAVLGAWFPCISPVELRGISYGNWVFEVKGKDAAGNENNEPTKYEWTTVFEPNKMYVRTISRPSDVVSSKEFSFGMQALVGVEDSQPDVLDTPLECSFLLRGEESVKDSKWEPCGSKITFDDVADGTYDFEVRTQDPLGHGEDSVSKSNIVVDRTPPVVTITQQPNMYHGAQTVRWNFASTEEVSGYSCSMVAKGKPSKFGSCAGDVEGSAEYTLEDGWYKFQVSGEDHAGNVGMSDVVQFMVDSQPPLIVVEKPKPSKQGKLDIGFQVMDNGGSGVIAANVSCLLRNEALEVSDDWVPECTSPVTYDLLEGRYIFNVRAVDRAGLHNEPDDHIIIVDSTPPTARITSTRPVGPQPAFVAFKFTGKDEPERIASLVNQYECKLEERTPHEDNIKDGSDMKSDHAKIELNVTKSSKSRLSSTANRNMMVQIKDGADVTLGRWVKCESPVVLTGLLTGRYAFQTRAIDTAGNIGKPTDSVVFDVDSSLPIPGKNLSQDPPAIANWVWIAVGAIAGTGILAIVAMVTYCRFRERRPRRTRYPRTPYLNRHRSGSSLPPTSSGGTAGLPQNESQDISSGASDDPMLSMAIRASMQTHTTDVERNRRLRDREENSRLQAAMEASIEEYRYQQAVQNSLQDTQDREDHWGENVFSQPSAPAPPSDITLTSPWAAAEVGRTSYSWTSANQNQQAPNQEN
ncbi:hypothetical protein BSKO_06033 [Bryopsis sp. KO-2023]|nr:hypothetical protein BSKO_06033 [Bryopsis sp. KO-2023]